ncbi:cation:proton antiporter [Candidatus Sumerlaeota bacterium]|nr:cation:proton antiporter [Candidatus Sumerlaeota bacterium]
MRVMTFTFLTSVYFLKADALVRVGTVIESMALIAILLVIKVLTKFIGVWPLTRRFEFTHREGMYTTLMMSTGLTFGSISALFGLNNGIITQQQYTILVAAVIGSAVVPTLIAQRWFQPLVAPVEEEIVERRRREDFPPSLTTARDKKETQNA